jgi:hypothetical protein
MCFRLLRALGHRGHHPNEKGNTALNKWPVICFLTSWSSSAHANLRSDSSSKHRCLIECFNDEEKHVCSKMMDARTLGLSCESAIDCLRFLEEKDSPDDSFKTCWSDYCKFAWAVNPKQLQASAQLTPTLGLDPRPVYLALNSGPGWGGDWIPGWLSLRYLIFAHGLLLLL